MSIGRSVMINQKGGKSHFHVPSFYVYNCVPSLGRPLYPEIPIAKLKPKIHGGYPAGEIWVLSPGPRAASQQGTPRERPTHLRRLREIS